MADRPLLNRGLRRAIAGHQQRFYGLEYDPESGVAVSTGAIQALAALPGLLEPGDEVIALDPCHDSCAACIAMAGALRVPVILRPSAFRPEPAELHRGITPRTRLLPLNSPHDRTGSVLQDEDLTAIAQLAVERDQLIISDEVYEHLVYDGVRHRPSGSLPGMRARTVSVSSAGKTFSFTGWKVGLVTAPPKLAAAVQTAKQYLTFTRPFQHAVAEALRLPIMFHADPEAGRSLVRFAFCKGADVVREPGARQEALAGGPVPPSVIP
nr:aminotransferase class I/II-fold pyridoxal phosphate-dependent enzyme [Streptomyces sp. ATCC 21386]